MPKTLNPAMRTHLAGGLTTLATACKVTRDDGTILGFTDHDESVVIAGVTYVAATGYVAANFAAKADLSVPNTEASGPIAAAGIADLDVRAGVYDFAKVRFFLYNWADLTMGTIAIPGHHLGRVTLTDHGFQAEILGIADVLRQQIVRLYNPQCDADFADLHAANRCKLDPATFTETGTVTAVASAYRSFTADITGSRAALFFVPAGLVTWVIGANAGRAREVKTDVLGSDPSRAIGLFTPAAFPIQIGDTFDILAGCNKIGRLGDCKVKFNNYVNFRGFDDIVGLDQALQTPNAV